ncbi:MAG: HD domain-containing protein [Pseudomonadales bacterium]|nr:HD domain-containing protein [Pseudomonadales bacterium]
MVSKGTPIKREIAIKILNHKLLKPLENSINIEDEINADKLLSRAKEFINSQNDLKIIHEKLNLDIALRALCKRYQKYPILTQKMTVLSLQLPEAFRKGLFCGWLSIVLAKQLEFNVDQTESAFIAGLAHDIGMLHIDPEILKKEDEYTPEEWRAMQSHAAIGHLIFRNIPGMSKDVSNAIFEHHERSDGTGYPNGKFAESLTRIGRIVALSDTLYPIRFKNFATDGRSLLDAIPIIQLKRPDHFYDIYAALALVCRSSNLTPKTIVDEEKMTEFINKQLADTPTLALACKVIIEIDNRLPDDDKRQLLIARNLTEKICSSLKKSGLLSIEIKRWMEYVRDNKLGAYYQEMEEIALMQQEMAWQINRAHRQLQLVINDGDLNKTMENKEVLEKLITQLGLLGKGELPKEMDTNQIDMVDMVDILAV